jgi:enoyl-CoA hydratase/carnithine racemase
MADVRVERDGDVAVLVLGDGENRFNADSVGAIGAALDAVEASDAAGLVTTARGKIWSNGLDLDWMGTSGAGLEFVRSLQALMARVLLFPMPTVAALNGHAFAGGAMLALAHDLRVMRADRGYFCLPEVDIGLPFTPGMAALVRERIPGGAALRDLAAYGLRVGAPEALARGIVDEAVAAEEVVPRAVARVRALAGKDRGTLAAVKRSLVGAVADALTA